MVSVHALNFAASLLRLPLLFSWVPRRMVCTRFKLVLAALISMVLSVSRRLELVLTAASIAVLRALKTNAVGSGMLLLLLLNGGAIFFIRAGERTSPRYSMIPRVCCLSTDWRSDLSAAAAEEEVKEMRGIENSIRSGACAARTRAEHPAFGAKASSSSTLASKSSLFPAPAPERTHFEDCQRRIASSPISCMDDMIDSWKDL
ncbi:hypothetical protein MPTK1_6g07330 [Marchantia polymorpha subsp. ruderalis]|uniref:Uncharacterized protein n=2 Tax=Marchantia polymorpha TaxID=3197 RepID=A0AAF6BPH1_MARPO|nr:hypothetical protein MARPO_0053s0047 [Marchantia polymorpha]BBN13905.1 hypothetical protein Mp_6g07330 [Marchantia polymorpha subsp. ruderalis]|eukprot:PTQ38107.1 hypothetical protein MARPO_0053s0047 [Marchantia polymorpha]